jgi:hypothetical protein
MKQADTDEGHGPEGALTSDEKSELTELRKVSAFSIKGPPQA